MPVRLSGTKNATPSAPARTAAGTAQPVAGRGPGHRVVRNDGGGGVGRQSTGAGAAPVRRRLPTGRGCARDRASPAGRHRVLPAGRCRCCRVAGAGCCRLAGAGCRLAGAERCRLAGAGSRGLVGAGRCRGRWGRGATGRGCGAARCGDGRPVRPRPADRRPADRRRRRGSGGRPGRGVAGRHGGVAVTATGRRDGGRACGGRGRRCPPGRLPLPGWLRLPAPGAGRWRTRRCRRGSGPGWPTRAHPPDRAT